jgi:hypothetical protein
MESLSTNKRNFQFHRQPLNHPLQLGDPLLFIATARFGGQDLGRALDKLGFPAREDL